MSNATSLDQLEALLLVQEHDTILDQLRHRRAALPERAELQRTTDELRVRVNEVNELRTGRDALLADERRLDDEARTVSSHAEDVDKKLYSGTVNSPRELQAMQADIDMLRRHQSEIEDRELEIMEQREALDAQVDAVEAAARTAASEVDRLQ